MDEGVENGNNNNNFNNDVNMSNKLDSSNNCSHQELAYSNIQLSNLLKLPKPTSLNIRKVSRDNAFLKTNHPLNPSSKSKISSNKHSSNDRLKTRSSISDLFGKSIRKKAQWKRKIEKVLNSIPVIFFMSFITLFSLFAADIQAACLPIEVDDPFNIFQCIILVIFLIELILNCLADDDYPLSYFFWLDLISTISMIQDIDYIMNEIVGYKPITSQSIKSRRKNVNQAAKLIASVSSASRTIRLLRIIRIFRLIRMVKLYKNVYIAKADAEKRRTETIQKTLERVGGNSSEISTSASKSNCKENRIVHPKSLKLLPISEHREEEEQSHSYQPNSPLRTKLRLLPVTTFSNGNFNPNANANAANDKNKQIDELDNDELLHESKISKMLTTSITKKIIILLVSLLIVFSVLSHDFYTDDSEITYVFLSKLLSNHDQILFKSHNTTLPDTVNITQSFDDSFPPINITYYNYPVYINEKYCNKEFRYKEVRTVFSDDASIQIVYSITTETKLIGLLNILQTLFVCICLAISSMSLEYDATKSVLQPLEVIIEIVENVARDPVNAKNVEELQSGIKASVEKISKDVSISYEIKVIKSAIIKIAALLAMGFGEAGGEIIKENLSSSHELNPMLKGKYKTAIFGFCDIRDFYKINIALEEKCIIFVNQIAEIVHSSVDRFKGATNKNIGDAFFNVWKFYNQLPIAKSNKRISIRDNLLDIDPSNPKVSIIADCSVLAFLRIILKINKNINMLSYRHNEKILALIPDYKVAMGFGLHLGYAIEGTIGSSYKIDASYLSPNVNIAARLESATRQFGVPLLLSGTLYSKLSEDLKSICRYVDCVIVKGSSQILDLYTIDLNLNVNPERMKSVYMISNNAKRFVYSEKKTILQNYIDQFGSITRLILEKQSYFELIRQREIEFTQYWNQAIFAYKCGDWKEAEIYFEKCAVIDPEDGPTKTLSTYIKNRGCNAPDGWYGVRELTTK